MTAMLPPPTERLERPESTRSAERVETRELVHHDNAPLPPLEVDDAHGLMRVASTTLAMRADHAPQLIDITAQLEAFVAASDVAHGQLLVYSMHTTAAVIVNEREPLLHQDIRAFLEGLAPAHGRYAHDDFSVRVTNMTPDEQVNGHAHLRHLLLGPSQTLPVVRGRLVLGRWQRVFFVELDAPRDRQVLLQLTGIKGY